MTTLITISLKLLVMEDDLDEGVETKDKLESILSAFRLDSLRPPTGSLQSTRTFKSHKAADMFTNIWSSVADARSIWHKDLLLVSRIKLCSNSNSYWLIRKWPSISNPWYHFWKWKQYSCVSQEWSKVKVVWSHREKPVWLAL